MIDCIYIAASAHDYRFTRICVGSVRYFYPTQPIRILPGGALRHGFERELLDYWNVEIADIPGGDYGWGFVKLEALFGHSGERFLVLDSDTAIIGPVLDMWTNGDSLFLVDDETQSESDAKRLYYDWDKLRAIDPTTEPPQFVFNSGQWFGTAGVLTREDFAPWVEWTMPRKLRYPSRFMPGDQGIFNYVLNQKARQGINIDRRKIMHWPGHGMSGVGTESISRRMPLVVHWAGMKAMRHRDMPGADLLGFFERVYFERIPWGKLRMNLESWRHVVSHWFYGTKVRTKLGARRLAEIAKNAYAAKHSSA